MGAPRKPTPLKVLHGTNRKDRANPGEPKPADLPRDSAPPDWLGQRGKAAWADILPILRNLGVMTVADPIALGLLCDALAEFVEARAVVRESGATYWTEGKSVMLRARPEVTIASDAWRRAKVMLTEFGLTPASRGRVTGTPAGEEDPLEKWAAGG